MFDQDVMACRATDGAVGGIGRDKSKCNTQTFYFIYKTADGTTTSQATMKNRVTQ